MPASRAGDRGDREAGRGQEVGDVVGADQVAGADRHEAAAGVGHGDQVRDPAAVARAERRGDEVAEARRVAASGQAIAVAMAQAGAGIVAVGRSSMAQTKALVAETGCAGVGIQTDGLVNPASADAWKRAGIVDDDSDNPMSDLLDGLVTRDRLYVVEPPG